MQARVFGDGRLIASLLAIVAIQALAVAALAQQNNPDTCPAHTAGASSKSVMYINPDTIMEADSYSKAAIVPSDAKIVYVSGQVPLTTSYELAGEDLRAQLHAVLRNLCLVLDAAGAKTETVFKLNVTYVHEKDVDPFVIAEEILAYFDRDEMPAMTLSAVTFLIAKGVRVQIDAMALLEQ